MSKQIIVINKNQTVKVMHTNLVPEISNLKIWIEIFNEEGSQNQDANVQL